MQAYDYYGRPFAAALIGDLKSAGTRANGKRTLPQVLAGYIYEPRPTDLPGLALYAPEPLSFDEAASKIIREFKPYNGGNFRSLAKRYGMSLVQIHKFIQARRPDLYERAANGEKAYSAFDVSKLSTSAASTPFRTSHRTDDAASNPAHSDSLKTPCCSKCSNAAQSLTNTAEVRHTGHSVHINADSPVRVSLLIDQASRVVLELKFASDDRNADIHTSCRV